MKLLRLAISQPQKMILSVRKYRTVCLRNLGNTFPAFEGTSDIVEYLLRGKRCCFAVLRSRTNDIHKKKDRQCRIRIT
jgi:hypothetical protein